MSQSANAKLVMNDKRVATRGVATKPDARQFFADVKTSQEIYGLVQVGKPRSNEIR
jgi:hypothetical protein